MSSYTITSESPATDALVVTPHDTNDLSTPCRALYIGTGGAVEVITLDGSSAVVFANVPSGAVLPVRVSRVLDGNTTADDILALY